MTKLLFFIVA